MVNPALPSSAQLCPERAGTPKAPVLLCPRHGSLPEEEPAGQNWRQDRGRRQTTTT